MFDIILILLHVKNGFYTMKLIILTKSTFFVEEDKILAALFEEGLDSLHLYKPGSSPMYSERLPSLLPHNCLNKITVHEHFYLKAEYQLAGIHLEDQSVAVPSGYKGKVSMNCSDIEQLKAVKKQSNYVFLKNIFDCREFPEQKSTFSMQELEDASRRGLIDKKVYAMGGMTFDNIRLAQDLGFGGVVICGDLWNRFDIHNQVDFKNVISHFERLKKAVE